MNKARSVKKAAVIPEHIDKVLRNHENEIQSAHARVDSIWEVINKPTVFSTREILDICYIAVYALVVIVMIYSLIKKQK